MIFLTMSTFVVEMVSPANTIAYFGEIFLMKHC